MAPVIIALKVMGELQKGAAAEEEARSAANIADYNAAVQRQEAEAIRQKARLEQGRQAERGVRIKSAQKAAIAKAGGIISPVRGDLEAEQAAELELENLLIGFEGEVGAKRAESQAELDRLQGKLLRKKGKRLRTASFFKAGSTLLEGFNP